VKLTYRLMITTALVLPMATSVPLVRAQEAKRHEVHEWDYGTEHGPKHWGDLKGEFASCKQEHAMASRPFR